MFLTTEEKSLVICIWLTAIVVPGCENGWIDPCMGCKRTPRLSDGGADIALLANDAGERVADAAPDVSIRNDDVGEVVAHFDFDRSGREDVCVLNFLTPLPRGFRSRDQHLTVLAQVQCRPWVDEEGDLIQEILIERTDPEAEGRIPACIAPVPAARGALLPGTFVIDLSGSSYGQHASTMYVRNARTGTLLTGDTICYALGVDDSFERTGCLGPQSGHALGEDQYLAGVRDFLIAIAPEAIVLGACVFATGGICAAMPLAATAFALVLSQQILERDSALGAEETAERLELIRDLRYLRAMVGVTYAWYAEKPAIEGVISHALRTNPFDLPAVFGEIMRAGEWIRLINDANYIRSSSHLFPDGRPAIVITARNPICSSERGDGHDEITFVITRRIFGVHDCTNGDMYCADDHSLVRCQDRTWVGTSCGACTCTGYADCSCAPLVDPRDRDDDGDRYTENDGDCNDADPRVNPGTHEVCNDIDDDCRNGIDDGGICDPPPPREVCNGLDDDGDGDRDEDFACELGSEHQCPTPCRTWGTTICTAECRLDGPCTPPREICNDIDDDCRNGIDDGGVCGGGCVPTGPEVCGNDIDEDCVDGPASCPPGCEFGACDMPGATWCAGGDFGRPQQCSASRCWVNLGDVCGGILDPCPQSCEIRGGTAQCVHHDPICPVAGTSCLDANTLATCAPGVLCARRNEPCPSGCTCEGGPCRCNSDPPACNCGEMCCEVPCQLDRRCECQRNQTRCVGNEMQSCDNGVWRNRQTCNIPEWCGGRGFCDRLTGLCSCPM